MAPFLNTLISRIVFGQTTKKRPDLPRPPSITFSEGDFPGGHQQWGSYPSQLASLGNSPTQGRPGAASYGNGSGQDNFKQPSLLGNSLSGNQAQAHAPTLEKSAVQTPVGQGNTTTVPGPDWQGSSEARHEQGQDMASSRQSASIGSAAPSTSNVGGGGNGHVPHGYNGSTTGSHAAAAALHAPDLSGPASNDIQGGTDSSPVPLSDSAGQVVATERPVSEQNSFIELVQGTEQLLGMLGARDIA